MVHWEWSNLRCAEGGPRGRGHWRWRSARCLPDWQSPDRAGSPQQTRWLGQPLDGTYWRNRKSWRLAKRPPASPPGLTEAVFV